ncbi:MAG: PIN domain-containing protein [Candidatus Limnocylindria bacterium]
MTMGGRGRKASPDRAYADTNLFIVLFAGETHPLFDTAAALFQRVAEGRLRLIVTPIVIGELIYVSERIFRWSRSAIGRRLGDLLGAQGLDVREAHVLARALDLYGSTRSLDFADAYLGAAALEAGPPRVASLDADLGRVPGITRIAG